MGLGMEWGMERHGELYVWRVADPLRLKSFNRVLTRGHTCHLLMNQLYRPL